MSTPGPVHFIAHFTVNDPDGYRLYEQGFFPILKAHGGHIRVASTEGAGTVFTVSLPLLSEPQTAPIELSMNTPALE